MGKPTRQIENTAPEKADEEDTRDIFEKALDYGVPIAGAYLGMKAGSRLYSGGKRRLTKLEEERSAAYKARDEAIKKREARQAVLHDHEIRGSNQAIMDHYNDRFFGGFMGGGMGGANAVYWNYLNNPSSGEAKRRAAWEKSQGKRRK